MKIQQRPITIRLDTFERLWQSKEKFRKLVGGKLDAKVTWDGFLEQAVLFLEAGYLLPSVKATRYNPYIYGAECPKCRVEEYPLRRRRRIIWKIKCSGCGEEYIALA